MTSPASLSDHSSAPPAAAGALTTARLDAELAAATADAQAIAAGLDDAEGRARPAAGGWSVAECLTHLAATTRIYLPVLHAAIARAHAEGRLAGRPFRLGLVGRWMVGSMEPPVRLPMRAPRAIAPPSDVALTDALRDFVATQDDLRRCVSSTAGLDLGAVRVASPIAPLLRLRLGTSLAVLAAHERRHLWQARRVREAVRGAN